MTSERELINDFVSGASALLKASHGTADPSLLRRRLSDRRAAGLASDHSAIQILLEALQDQGESEIAPEQPLKAA